MAEILCLKCKKTVTFRENCKCFIYENIDKNHSLPTLDEKDQKIPEIVEAKDGNKSKSIEYSDKLCSEFHQIHIENFDNINPQKNENNKEVEQISDLNELINFGSFSDDTSTNGIFQNQNDYLMSASNYLEKVYSDELLSFNDSAQNFDADYKSVTEFHSNFNRYQILTSGFNYQTRYESNPSSSTDQSPSEKFKMPDQKRNFDSVCSEKNLTKYSLDAVPVETHFWHKNFPATANFSLNTNFTKRSYKEVNEKAEGNLTDPLNFHEVASQPVIEKISLVDKVSEAIEPMKDANSAMLVFESDSDLNGSQTSQFNSIVANGEFTSKRELDNYQSNICEKKYKKCEKRIFSQISLNKHYEYQSDKNLNVCGNFQNLLSGKNQLEPHKTGDNNTYNRIHTIQTLFVCDKCEKRFVTKTGLVVHHRTHIGEKPIECDICKRRFILKSTLKSHYKIHANKKPFVCDMKKRF